MLVEEGGWGSREHPQEITHMGIGEWIISIKRVGKRLQFRCPRLSKSGNLFLFSNKEYEKRKLKIKWLK